MDKNAEIKDYNVQLILKLEKESGYDITFKSFEPESYPERICTDILYKAGLSCRTGFYLGRGVRASVIGTDHLIKIYGLLKKISPLFSDEFVKLLDRMETIGGTELINTFYRFGRNCFISDGVEIATNNFVGENATHEEMIFTAINEVYEKKSYNTLLEKFKSKEIIAGLHEYIKNTEGRTLNPNYLDYLNDPEFINYNMSRKNKI